MLRFSLTLLSRIYFASLDSKRTVRSMIYACLLFIFFKRKYVRIFGKTIVTHFIKGFVIHISNSVHDSKLRFLLVATSKLQYLVLWMITKQTRRLFDLSQIFSAGNNLLDKIGLKVRKILINWFYLLNILILGWIWDNNRNIFKK